MRPVGALLIVLGLIALGASRLVTIATLDVVLVAVGLVLLLAGLALIVFGRSNRERREERRIQDGADDGATRVTRATGPDRVTGSVDRDLSSPVPLGPSSEAGAMSGTGTSAPAPIVPSSELPAGSTASASYAPPMPAAPALDDGTAEHVDREIAARRDVRGPQHPALEDADGEPR